MTNYFKNQINQKTYSIYIPYKLSNLGFSNEKYLDNDTDLSESKVAKFKEDFKNMSMNGYIIGSLVSDCTIDDKSEERLIIRLKVPSNTNMLYKDDSVILDKGHCIEIKEFKEIDRNGRKILKAEADIIDKNVITDMISEKERLLNERLMDKVNINDSINFEISGIRSQIILNRAEKVINNYIDVVPEKILKDVFSKKNSSQPNTLKINFVSTVIDNKFGLTGKYEAMNNKITINSANIALMPGEGSLRNYLRSSLHELSHAIDYNCLSNDITKYYSDSGEFKKFYDDESKNITFETSSPSYNDKGDLIPYAQKDNREYFAEILSAYFSKDEEFKEKIRSQVPRTYAHIKNLIENYK